LKGHAEIRHDDVGYGREAIKPGQNARGYFDLPRPAFGESRRDLAATSRRLALQMISVGYQFLNLFVAMLLQPLK
jgi:hypothetical protein